MAEATLERPDLPPLVSPAANGGILEVFRRRYLLKLLVRREISARYQGSVLGLLWSYLNPLSQFLIYYVVFGIIMGRNRTEAYPIHLFTGLVIVHFFCETLTAGTRSIVRNRRIVEKMALPREMFPVASMLVSAFHIGPQLVILVIAAAFWGWVPDVTGLMAAVLGLLVCASLGTSLALIFSAANVFLRDIGNGVSILTNFVRFGVPMMYPFENVVSGLRDNPRLIDLYLANPIAEAVLLFQRGFWVGATHHPQATIAHQLPSHLFLRGGVALVACLLLLAFSQLAFSRLEGKMPERL